MLDLLEDCFSLYMQATPSLKKLLNGVFFTAVAINPQDDASGVSRMATAHLQPVISVLRQFDGEVDDGGKENTTRVSTASGVHDNACLSKGIVVRLGRLELPRPHGHWNLNPARLPIPPQALQGVIIQWLADSSKYRPALSLSKQPHPAHSYNLTSPLR